ncbi:MAG: 4Fe-4S binding protein [Desulfovibrionaceae bacterium]|nr:4Fe-4S binding protein [Desulfovibrionaceae bacterium]
MKSHTLNKAWCKGCGICVAFCPKKALSLDEQSQKAVWDGEKCIYCGICEHYCPDLAITVVNVKEAANG